VSLYASGNQTVGPYLHIGLTWLITRKIAGPRVSGERVTIQGRLLDGDGKAVSDGMIEIWQANSHGKYAHPEDKQKKPLERGFQISSNRRSLVRLFNRRTQIFLSCCESLSICALWLN